MKKEQPEIKWVRLSDAINLLWQDNSKLHDLGSLYTAIERYGFQELPKLDKQLKNKLGEPRAIKSGNGRIEALQLLKKDGKNVPRGILQDTDGEWLVPILFGVDGKTEAEAIGYAFDANNLTMTGGDFTAYDIAKLWNGEYIGQLRQLAEQDALPVSVSAEDLGSLLFVPDFEPVGIDEQGKLDEKKKVICPECGHEFTP